MQSDPTVKRAASLLRLKHMIERELADPVIRRAIDTVKQEFAELLANGAERATIQ